MSNEIFDLNIEGDFLDSFIYSGVLYLIDFDLQVTSYKWKEICSLIKERQYKHIKTMFNYIVENSTTPPINQKKQSFTISLSDMSKIKKSITKLKCYPSDLYIFSNKMYYSGETGTYKIGTEHIDAKFTDKDSVKIFDQRCFSISPNTNNRIALASGDEGVFVHAEQKTKIVSTSPCVDIDWVNNNLLINSTSHHVLAKKYESIPNNIADLESNKENILNNLEKLEKTSTAQIMMQIKNSSIDNKTFNKIRKILINQEPEDIPLTEEYNYSWSSGDYDFFSKNNTIDIYQLGEFLMSRKIHQDIKKSEKIRTSGCGTIIESENKIYRMNHNTTTLVDNDIAKWRVFPRAKSHANHLHIIKDDYINIKIFNRSDEDEFSSSLTKKQYNDLITG